ncbi:ABC transporter ATP-binding protein [Xanthobacter dioxanivorans]|uniref:ABC transporter ATP-binding protein n=1 Tax=Xanthobacter dioxanivorans TaxID=2528964 RepID=A0A974PMR9_9HYPH|nr:ABC transporter ATP-binding protein [Xanthobacter dioxanivorans]QRG06061.1 ABC transporter ATP-binding protein [Xanthobacter dioxanivorans]
MSAAIEPGIAIEVRNVCKTFGGAREVVALRDVDLTLQRGEFAAVLGASGCGKSTLLSMLAGFEKASSGTMSAFGHSIEKPDPERAMVFQEAALFPWLSVWENMVFSPKNRSMPKARYEDKARRLLDAVGLGAFHHHHPEQLSGGMKQRVGIARALLMEPKVLLMDEPFGALDAQTRLEMQELLLDIWSRDKRTVMFITHDIEEAIFLSDVVYVMTARPGTMKARIEIPLGRPRHVDMLTTPEFSELRRQVMGLIREEVARARAEASAAA